MTTYLYFTLTLFAVTAILTGREIKRRRDFTPVAMSGTLNVFHYYLFLRHQREPVSVNIWLFIAAHLNLLACAALFLYRAISA